MKLSNEVKAAVTGIVPINHNVVEIIEHGYLIPVLTSTEMLSCKFPKIGSVVTLFENKCAKMKEQGIEMLYTRVLEKDIISALYYPKTHNYFDTEVIVQTPYFVNEDQLRIFFELIVSCNNLMIISDYRRLSQSLNVLFNANKAANNLTPYTYQEQLEMFSVGFCTNLSATVEQNKCDSTKETIYDVISALKTSAQNEKSKHDVVYRDIVREIIKFQYEHDSNTRTELLKGLPTC